MLNYDMFGGCSEPPEPLKSSKKLPTMQEMHGVLEGYKCKECKHLIKRQYSGTYYKCELWRMTNSEASDVRLKNTACGKFEKEDLRWK